MYFARTWGDLCTAVIRTTFSMPKRPAPAGSRQRWATFLRNHLHEILAVGSMGLDSGRFAQLFVLRGRTDLPKNELAAYEEIASAM